MNKFIDLAISLAKTSEHSRTRVGAVLLHKRKIISVGVNSNKSHPMQYFYNTNHKDFGHTLRHHKHAETDAIIKYKRMGIEIPKLKLIVARLNKDGTLALGRPCSSCMATILDFNINTILYSTESDFIMEKL